MDINDSVNLREKTLAICQQSTKFVNIFCYTIYEKIIWVEIDQFHYSDCTKYITAEGKYCNNTLVSNKNKKSILATIQGWS